MTGRLKELYASGSTHPDWTFIWDTNGIVRGRYIIHLAHQNDGSYYLYHGSTGKARYLTELQTVLALRLGPEYAEELMKEKWR